MSLGGGSALRLLSPAKRQGRSAPPVQLKRRNPPGAHACRPREPGGGARAGAPWRPPAHGGRRRATELLCQPACSRCLRGKPRSTATRPRACCARRRGGSVRRQAARVSRQETVCTAWLEQQASRRGFNSRLLTPPAAPRASRFRTPRSNADFTPGADRAQPQEAQREPVAAKAGGIWKPTLVEQVAAPVRRFALPCACVASSLTAYRRHPLALPRALSPSARRRRSGASPGIN